MISIKNLNKTYSSGTQAVSNLSLEVSQGEIFALLGPNGAGKSSTIRVLTTLSGFDTGEVEVAGFNVDTHAQNVRASIGYVAQDTGVDFFLTGRENLTLQGHLYKMAKDEIDKRINELADYFGLQEVLDELVSSYSGGMRRKLDIATSLLHKPKIIFLDEPTLGLDTQSRQNLWQYIRKLNTELKLTILLTTHYLEEADKLASRVAIIDKGQIKITGTPEELKDQIQGDVVSLQFDDIPNKNEVTGRLEKNSFVRDKKWEQNKLHLYVSNGASCIPQLIEECNQMKLHVKNVSFARPSLDDVFIKITGGSIEAKSEEGEEKWWEKWAGKGGGAWAKKWQEKNATNENDSDAKSDWQGEASKWSAEEQKQWWQQQSSQTSASIESPIAEEKTAMEDSHSKQSDANSSNQVSQQETTQTGWKAEASKWSEEEQKAWWSSKMQSANQSSSSPAEEAPDKKAAEVQWPNKPWPNKD